MRTGILFILFLSVTLGAQSQSGILSRHLHRVDKLLEKFEKKYEDMLADMQGRADSTELSEHINTTRSKGQRYYEGLDTLSTFMKQLSEEGYEGLPAFDELRDKQLLLQSYQRWLREAGKTGKITDREMQKLYAKVYKLESELDGLLRLEGKQFDRLLKLARKHPGFEKFFSSYSDYSRLFGIPWQGMEGGNASMLSGYQTLESVQSSLTGQYGAQLQNLMPDVSNLRGMLEDRLRNEWAERMDIFGQRINENIPYEDLPKDSIPSLGKKLTSRLEYSINMQSVKSNAYWPMTTDWAGNIGYRFSKQGVIGIGLSGKTGWGKNIQAIRITGEGFSIRSFLDYKIKGSFYITGGYELNHQPARDSLNNIIKSDLPYFTQSGLIGISKIVSIRHKFFKKTKVQLLWDFLSYQQRPRPEAIKFRLGYSF